MARIRTIKPEFFTSEDIVELEPLARLLYIALWCEADKEGRFSWKPKTFKMRYLPADSCDFQSICDGLLKSGLVRLYGDGLAYIPSFLKHQHINPRESVSTLPAPEDCEKSFPRKITQSIRKSVMDRDDNQCVRCGSSEDLTLDHILPQSLGGPHIEENLRVMCRKCNSARPVSGDALVKDLALDDLTKEGLKCKFGIDASPRVGTDETRAGRKEGREGKGKVDASRRETPIPEDFSVSERVKAWAELNGYDQLETHLANFVDSCRAKGYKYIDWDAAFRNAISKNWAKVKERPKATPATFEGKPIRDPMIYGFDVANGDPLPDGWKLPPTGETRYMAGIGWVLSSPKPKDKPLRVVA